MKILIVTGYFFPESFKCNDMAFELKARGHDVTVLTSIPNYPEGRFAKGYGLFKKRTEVVNGVKVIRSTIIPRGNGSKIKLALNYLSYTVCASIRAFIHGISHKYDAILVHEVSPVFVGIPAIIASKLTKAPIYFWVLDLWPESLSSAGGVSSKRVLNAISKLTRYIYNNSYRILIGSLGYRESINKMGDYDKKIIYFPNWIDKDLTISNNGVKVPVFPQGFNVLVAGNIGVAQDFPSLIEAARGLKDKSINIIIVGDGRMKEWVIAKKNEYNLANVYLMGRYPLSSMPAIFSNADVLYCALKDTPIFSLTVPSRIQAYMWAGKPIVAMINGEGADLINKAKAGIAVPAERPDKLIEALKTMAELPHEKLLEIGNNGKQYSIKHFDFRKCMDHLEEIIQNGR